MKQCRVCKWQEGNPSIVVTTWSNAAEDLCSNCANALEAIATWSAAAWIPNIFRLASEAIALIPFEALKAALFERDSRVESPAEPPPTPLVPAALGPDPRVESVTDVQQQQATPAAPENWENTR